MAGSERIEGLTNYTTPYTNEQPFISRFVELLQGERCFFRDYLPGHITGSAWIVNEARTHALLVHHAKLHKWLQPGGHADGDENVQAVALREANEETGLTKLQKLTPGIFDLDIHPIPARNDFPAHLHYDVRYAFTASQNDELLLSDESIAVKWIPLDEIPALSGNNDSILRMIAKTKAI